MIFSLTYFIGQWMTVHRVHLKEDTCVQPDPAWTNSNFGMMYSPKESVRVMMF